MQRRCVWQHRDYLWKRRPAERDGPVVGIERVELESKVVDQRVINPETRTDSSLALTEGIPGNRGSGRKQALGIIFGERGIPYAGVGQKDTVAIGNVVCGATRYFIPSRGEFVP